MTFYDKYPQLKQKKFLQQLVVETVFATMALEDQTVPIMDVENLVSTAIEKEKLHIQ